MNTVAAMIQRQQIGGGVGGGVGGDVACLSEEGVINVSCLFSHQAITDSRGADVC